MFWEDNLHLCALYPLNGPWPSNQNVPKQSLQKFKPKPLIGFRLKLNVPTYVEYGDSTFQFIKKLINNSNHFDNVAAA